MPLIIPETDMPRTTHPLRAFFAHPELSKEIMLAEARAHRAADRYISGQYWDPNAGRGCAVGCAVVSINARAKLGLLHADHAGVAAALGWPKWLAHAEDCIFEGLPAAERAAWPEAIIEAIPAGADLSGMRDQWFALMLRQVVLPVAGTSATIVERVKTKAGRRAY